MNIQEKSRTEYLSRLNRVMDYIDMHLDQPLDLKEIAGVAHFSPYHFHRIFTFLLGETPTGYIQRLRMEKAACKLRNEPLLPVTDVAYHCGFGSISLFSRTFKKYFGVTPTQFGRLEHPVYACNGKLFSKNGQMLGKNVTSGFHLDSDLCGVELKNIYFMESNVEIKEMPEMKVVYCRQIGPFHLIGEAYGKLAQWAVPRGLYIPNVTKTVTVTHDDPSVTDLDKVRQSACILVSGEVKVEGEIGKMTIPGGRYVVGHFELGMDEFQKAWNTMCHWFTESGYQQGDGCTYELYHNDYTTHPERKHIVDICIPIKLL